MVSANPRLCVAWAASKTDIVKPVRRYLATFARTVRKYQNQRIAFWPMGAERLARRRLLSGSIPIDFWSAHSLRQDFALSTCSFCKRWSLKSASSISPRVKASAVVRGLRLDGRNFKTSGVSFIGQERHVLQCIFLLAEPVSARRERRHE